MAQSFQGATQAALAIAQAQALAAAERLNQQQLEAAHPSSVERSIDGQAGAGDSAYRLIGSRPSRIVYRYSYMQDVVDFALATLRERSPIGSGADKHPGLYRDSHKVFLNGHVVADVRGWRPGDQINIASAVAYARRIETGAGKMTVPGHVYEAAALIVASRFGNQAAVRFTFMPVRFGDVAAYASFSRQVRTDRRRLSDKARQDWLVRQPALEIRGR